VPARAALIALLTVVGLGASPGAAQGDVSTSNVSGGPAATASTRRAVVIGTYAVLPSGRVHVSLASDAARVRLTYRNTDGRSRSRVVRIRGGKAVATLASGSRNLKARALATRPLRASGRVRLRRNPMLQDVDGNGIRESHYDLDTDGSYETVLFDDNSNGRFEMVFFDTSAGSVLFRDQNEDGYFELTALDADRNSQLERLFYDGDGDGYAELECLDSIGPDGLADTWVDTRVSSRDAQDRAANDLMVQNIVALNQLRQLDPWSTAYIPYDPAPSLLR
jgi:hypothetical protein